jgi:hypothetical protein
MGRNAHVAYVPALQDWLSLWAAGQGQEKATWRMRFHPLPRALLAVETCPVLLSVMAIWTPRSVVPPMYALQELFREQKLTIFTTTSTLPAVTVVKNPVLSEKLVAVAGAYELGAP